MIFHKILPLVYKINLSLQNSGLFFRLEYLICTFYKYLTLNACWSHWIPTSNHLLLQATEPMALSSTKPGLKSDRYFFPVSNTRFPLIISLVFKSWDSWINTMAEHTFIKSDCDGNSSVRSHSLLWVNSPNSWNNILAWLVLDMIPNALNGWET